MRLEFGLDHQIDVARSEHAISVAIAAIARQPRRPLDLLKALPVARAHQQWTCGAQHGVLNRGAGAYRQGPIAGRTAITGAAAIAGKMLASERLMHHAVDRLAAAGQRDERSPGWHAADKRFGSIDRIEHPDVFGVAPLDAKFLADDAVLRKSPFDQRAHGCFGGAIGGGHRIEAARTTLVFNAERTAKERPNGLAGNGGELVDKGTKVDRRHQNP